jgi:hypothetical protein
VKHEPVRIRPRQLDQRPQRRQGRTGLLLGWLERPLADEPPEHRIARVLGDALAAEEREVGALEVARAPTEHRRVERDHDRRAAAPLGACGQALDERVRPAPVELEPVRGVLENLGQALHRLRGLVREDHRRAGVARGARQRAIGLRVRELEHPDGREQERVRQAPPEQLDAGVPSLDVAQHPGHDPPPVECGTIGGHRALVARARGHVGERLGAHAFLRRRLEPVSVEWNVRPPAADAVEVDPCLAPHADHAAASQHT